MSKFAHRLATVTNLPLDLCEEILSFLPLCSMCGMFLVAELKRSKQEKEEETTCCWACLADHINIYSSHRSQAEKHLRRSHNLRKDRMKKSIRKLYAENQDFEELIHGR